jgi:hypothetical protein
VVLTALLLLAGAGLGAGLAGCGDGGGCSGGSGGGAAGSGGAGGSGGSGGSGGASSCSSADDCRLYDSYCEGAHQCQCIPLRKTEVDPPCLTRMVSCLVAPCVQKVAACENQVCVANPKP